MKSMQLLTQITSINKMKEGFAERFEQFKTNESTLAFIVNPLNTNAKETFIEPFGIDAGYWI